MTDTPDLETLVRKMDLEEMQLRARMISLMSAQTPRLNKALAAVQAEMGTVQRDRRVDVETKGDKPNYSYSYATLANVSAAVLPLLGRHGLSFTAWPGMGSDGKGMSLKYALLHESGEERTGEFPLSAEGGIQMLGGRVTYIRRYCLLAVTGLAADEDDDAAAAQMADEGKPRTAQRNAPAVTNKPASQRRPTAQTEHDSAVAPELPGGELPAEDLATDPMKTKIIMQFKDLKLGEREQRDERNRLVSDIVGREITTITKLTRTEGKLVIDRLDELTAERLLQEISIADPPEPQDPSS